MSPTNGTSKGDGTRSRPWDLATALSHPANVKPGDTLWLRGGTYRGSFTSRLTGTESAPIVVEQAPNEHAILDLQANEKGPVALTLYGAWTHYQGFEVLCSNLKRRTEIKGSWPADLHRGSIEARGSQLKFINLIVRDLGKGFGFWSEGIGGEIYGCLIYNNGWSAPDRGHGHAIYTQNKEGVKRIVDNIIFNHFQNGIDVYGSVRATLRGFHIEGNISFHNGSLYKPGQLNGVNILVGGECPFEDIVVDSNCTYQGGMQLGYLWGNRNENVLARNNYLHGGLSAYFQEDMTFEKNVLLGAGPLVRLTLKEKSPIDKIVLSKNTYFLTDSKFGAFAMRRGKTGGSMVWADWQAKGFDKSSIFTKAKPTGVHVVVRPNRYEKGRAHLAIYNWDEKETVPVDLSKVLKKGQPFRIVSARSFHGPPIVSGTYDGQPVTLSMKPTKPEQPIGLPEYPLPALEPQFGAFVVLLTQKSE